LVTASCRFFGFGFRFGVCFLDGLFFFFFFFDVFFLVLPTEAEAARALDFGGALDFGSRPESPPPPSSSTSTVSDPLGAPLAVAR
jgi:hypothetical protein